MLKLIIKNYNILIISLILIYQNCILLSINHRYNLLLLIITCYLLIIEI